MPRMVQRCAPSTVLLCLFLSPMICRLVQAQPYVDERPQDATVRQGDNVTFFCDLRNTNGYNIYWFYEQGQTRYLSRGREIGVVSSLSPGLASRLSIIGDESQEEFTLRMENVQEADTGTYECQYAPAVDGASVTPIGMAQLTVLVPPNPQSPDCTVRFQSGSDGPFTIDDSVYLYCFAAGGSPVPYIIYYREDERLTAAAQNFLPHPYRLSAEDNGVTFMCSMTTPALDEPRNCSVMPLRILPNATIEPAVSRVEEGSYASFECYGEGVPNIAGYSWEVRNTDTGEILPSERFTLDNRSLEIEVLNDIELLCIVSVPSGLSGNATATVEVIKREETTVRVGSTNDPGPSNEPSSYSSPTVIIAAVVSVLALVIIIVVAICLWKRKQQRKPSISTNSEGGCKMGDIGVEYDEIGRTAISDMVNETDARTENGTGNGPNGAQQDKLTIPFDCQPPGMSLYAQPDKQVKTNGSPRQDTASDVDGPPIQHLPSDTPLLYAQPDKAVKTERKPADVDESEYSTVAADEPAAADSGLVYADLDLTSPDTATANTGPSSRSEQTVYASIRS